MHSCNMYYLFDPLLKGAGAGVVVVVVVVDVFFLSISSQSHPSSSQTLRTIWPVLPS